MFLLADPEYRFFNDVVRRLTRINGPLSFLCYVAALVWFLMLGFKEFNMKTYFSEPALRTNSPSTKFEHSEYACRKIYDELTHEIQEYRGTNVYGILRAQRSPSVDALVLTAPHHAPDSHQKDTAAGIALMLAFAQFARSQIYWGKDIIFLVTQHEQLGMQAWLEAYHGIQRDPDTFYTTLGGFWKPGTPTLDLRSLGIVFKHKKYLKSGKLTGRSGSIQAAINLEIHTPNIKYIEVKLEGLNGQLANLDLSNVVHKACVISGIRHSFKNSYSWIRSRTKLEKWTSGVRTMLGQVVAQIAGVPSGNHGLFHRFGIDAVTLEGRDASDPAGAPPKVKSIASANFHRLAVTLEITMHYLNNLLERFHQSYFFYLLTATNRFISIALYMPSLCLLCVAMLIRMLSMQQDNEKDKPTSTPKRKLSNANLPGEEKSKEMKGSSENDTMWKRKQGSESGEKKPVECLEQIQEKSDLVKDRGQKGKNSDVVPENKISKKHKENPSLNLVKIGANFLLVHFLGYAVMNSPMLLYHIGTIYDLPSEVSVYYGLIAISILLTIISPFLPRLLRTGRMTHEELSLVNILVLVELATVCLSVGMQNFPLGLAIAVIYTPVALTVRVVTKNEGKKSAIVLFLRRAFCLLLHPMSAITVPMMLYSHTLSQEDSWLDATGRGRDAAMQAVMFSVIDSLIYGNWLFNLVTAVILPIWLIFWQILCNKVDAPV